MGARARERAAPVTGSGWCSARMIVLHPKAQITRYGFILQPTKPCAHSDYDTITGLDVRPELVLVVENDARQLVQFAITDEVAV